MLSGVFLRDAGDQRHESEDGSEGSLLGHAVGQRQPFAQAEVEVSARSIAVGADVHAADAGRDHRHQRLVMGEGAIEDRNASHGGETRARGLVYRDESHWPGSWAWVVVRSGAECSSTPA